MSYPKKPGLANYCVLETDGRETVVLGNLQGKVTVARLVLGTQDRLEDVRRVQAVTGKVAATVVLGSHKVLVGVVLYSPALAVVGQATMPIMKWQLARVGVRWGDKVLVGDRCGGVNC